MTKRTDIEQRAWLDLWADMVGSVAEWLPDVDLPINVMDESRVVVPWEEINGYMGKEREGRRVLEDEELVTEYSSAAALKKLDAEEKKDGFYDPGFEGMGPYWELSLIHI